MRGYKYQMQEGMIDHEKIAFDKLTGKYKHYCADWDDMAIDENCMEFSSCGCYDNGPESDAVLKIQTEMIDEMNMWEDSFINWLEGVSKKKNES